MSLAETLARGQVRAEARMTSTCNIRRVVDSHPGVDPTTGIEAPTWEVVYAGAPCRIAGSRGAAQSRTESVGGVDVQVALRVGHLPVACADLRDGDFLEVLSGDCAGIVFRVVEVDWQDQATARRVPMVTVDRPSEWS